MSVIPYRPVFAVPLGLDLPIIPCQGITGQFHSSPRSLAEPSILSSGVLSVSNARTLHFRCANKTHPRFVAVRRRRSLLHSPANIHVDFLHGSPQLAFLVVDRRAVAHLMMSPWISFVLLTRQTGPPSQTSLWRKRGLLCSTPCATYKPRDTRLI